MPAKTPKTAPKTMPKKLTKKGLQTQERVIAAGISCVARFGFHGASTNKIAEHAGVTWGTLQHQFGDKATLLSAILDSAYQQQTVSVRQRVSMQTPLAQRVGDLIEAMWDFQNTEASLALDDTIRGVLTDEDLRPRLLGQLRRLRDDNNQYWKTLFHDTALNDEQFETAKQLCSATVRGLAADRSVRSSETPILAAKEQLKIWLASYMMQGNDSPKI